VQEAAWTVPGGPAGGLFETDLPRLQTARNL